VKARKTAEINQLWLLLCGLKSKFVRVSLISSANTSISAMCSYRTKISEWENSMEKVGKVIIFPRDLWILCWVIGKSGEIWRLQWGKSEVHSTFWAINNFNLVFDEFHYLAASKSWLKGKVKLSESENFSFDFCQGFKLKKCSKAEKPESLFLVFGSPEHRLVG
jgi:hypothetical protein